MNENRPLRIALTKGRLEKDTVALLEKLGYDCTQVHEKGRRLILPVGDSIEVVLAKAADVITYVEHGVCDLGFGRCRFALAGKKGDDFYSGTHVRTIATKYPNVARGFFEKKNMDVEIVKIEGSVELAPLLGLSHAIVDIVETGTTLKENGLEVFEYICPISARLIANMVSLKLRQEEIEGLIARIERELTVNN